MKLKVITIIVQNLTISEIVQMQLLRGWTGGGAGIEGAESGVEGAESGIEGAGSGSRGAGRGAIVGGGLEKLEC